jgi:thiamine pyrophosphate-dependent acetolactate synthase large subunit-like protein
LAAFDGARFGRESRDAGRGCGWRRRFRDPAGVAARSRNFPATDLTPSPNFEMTAQACGAYAERVEDPSEVPQALQRALKVVKEEKRQALLNVICRNPLA